MFSHECDNNARRIMLRFENASLGERQYEKECFMCKALLSASLDYYLPLLRELIVSIQITARHTVLKYD